MTTQQAQFASTIRGMKRALKRRPSSPSPSSSSDEAHLHTNRGNKLHKRAKYVREGRLDDTGGLAAWKKSVNHAGYRRDIIARNPRLYDAEGDVYEPTESDYEHDALSLKERGVESIEDNPFGDVRLEHLLRPLTAAAELADHPSLSQAYKSKALTQMAADAEEMLRRERVILWKVKGLLRRLRGDAEWVPCGEFEDEGDEGLLLPVHEGVLGNGSGVPTFADAAENHVAEVENGSRNGDTAEMRVGGGAVDGVNAMDMAMQQAEAEAEETTAHTITAEGAFQEDITRTEYNSTANEANAEPPTTENGAPEETNAEEPPSNSSNTPTTAPLHAMTTRAKARSPPPSQSPPSPTSSTSSIPSIHPWYLPPTTSSLPPSRDFGLPAGDAEEIRRLLLLYTQKQEAIVRSLSSLCSGLQKADRMRKEVFRAAKAEGHTKWDPKAPAVVGGPPGGGRRVTEMSDGEDWVDLEEWGLAGLGKLEKGKDEVEDLGGEEGEGGRGVRGGRRRRGVRM